MGRGEVRVLLGRPEFDQRALSTVKRCQGFLTVFGQDVLYIETGAVAEFFEERVYLVWVDTTGAYIASVTSTSQLIHGMVTLVCAPFQKFYQRLHDEHRITAQGIHLYVRGSSRKIHEGIDDIDPPQTLPS